MPQFGPGILKLKEGRFQRPATLNTVSGKKVYGENLITKDKKEYRVWDPYRSKYAAYIIKGGKVFPFKEDSSVLYLGASSGTTVSHLADIITKGRIYAVEFAPRSMRDLKRIAEGRPNIIPILADARHPEDFQEFVSHVDIIYQDIAQPDQGDILLANRDYYMPHGTLIYMVKARSTDVTKKPKEIFNNEVQRLTQKGVKILDRVIISPFEKDHIAIVGEVRGKKKKHKH